VYPALSQKKDAIGVRIIPNPEHLPVLVWYQDQNFTGSPQPVLIDGYDGVKDGNTVYVNVANVVNTANHSFSGNVYTNIYVISYNEGAGQDVSQIFDQIISNWKFNSNISDGAETRLGAPMKPALRRDTRRLADMSFIHRTLGKYYEGYGKYPDLSAGTYIKGETMSRWPSWQSTLGNTLGIAMPVDPLNTFYGFDICPSPNCECEKISDLYDGATCWNQQTKEFNTEGNIEDGLARGNLYNAFVYYYKSTDNGMNVNVNVSGWETPYFDNSAYGGFPALTVDNNDPVIQSIATVTMNYSEDLVIGMKATDRDISTQDIAWTLISYDTSCLASASLAPVNDKADGWSDNKNRFESYKNVKIKSKNQNCNGEIKLKAEDGDGGSGSYEMEIIVKNMPAIVMGLSNDTGIVDTGKGDVEFKTEILTKNKDGNTLKWTTTGFNFAGISDLNNSASNEIKGTFNAAEIWPITITVTDQHGNSSNYQTQVMSINNPPVITSPNSSSMVVEDTNWEFNIEGHDQLPYYEVDGLPHPHDPVKYSLNGNPDWVKLTGAKITVVSSPDIDVADYKFTIIATDKKGAFSEQNFTLKALNNPPVITEYPSDGIVRRADGSGSYQVKAVDPDGHNLTYSISVYKNLLKIDQTGKITGTFKYEDAGIYDVTITVSDGYKGGIATKSFTLQLNSFCGDKKKQEPNMERKDGPNDDGHEDCDHNGYATPKSEESARDNQYECYNNCSFSDMGINSGWCGDGVVQDGYGEECDTKETKEDYESRMGYDSGISEKFWQSIILSCEPDCSLGCDSERDQLGLGCYLEINGVVSCQKGKKACIDDEVTCVDIFTPVDGNEIYDYCCYNESIELKDGIIHDKSFDIVRAIDSDYEDIAAAVYDHGSLETISTSYYCDNVCRKIGKICVGVGLNNPAVSPCVAVQHDNGNDCNNSSNLVSNNCTARFGKYSDTDCFDGSPPDAQNTFYIGETACYCY